jgi:hypothetical protein
MYLIRWKSIAAGKRQVMTAYRRGHACGMVFRV